MIVLTLDIPDELLAAAGLAEGRVECEVRKVFALCLYGRGVLSAGKAAELPAMTRREFEELLAERRIERPLSVADLEQEFDWAASR